MCKECGCGITEISDKEAVEIFENKFQALHNKKHFEEYKIYAINLMGAPGSGKTALLEKTFDILKDKYHLGVIEGELETERDAEKIRKKGIPVYQINTRNIYHLDAALIHKAIHHLPLEQIDILFVENIGNLVYPENYELGTHLNVALLSVPEGEDKPEKYPFIFKISDIVLITKIDLLPYFDFNLEKVKENIKKINPKAYIITLSTKTREGMEDWINFVENKFREYRKNLY